MKKFLIFLSTAIVSISLIIFDGQPVTANTAQPCPTDADIIFNGNEYHAISDEWDGINFGWVVGADEIMTAWDEDSCGTDIWADYQAYLTQGTWKIGVCAINWLPNEYDLGLKDEEGWYPFFELSNSLNDDIIYVPASNAEIYSGFITYEVPTNGDYTVRFRWLNDKTEGNNPDYPNQPLYDANITIVKVFFDKIVDLPLTLDINPDTLNLKSRGNYITGYIELPYGYDISDIDISTVKLIVNGSDIDAQDFPFSIGDYNNNGIPDLMIKFDRKSVQEACGDTGLISFTLNCSSQDGQSFSGTDDVFVIDKGKEHISEDQDSVVY